MDGDSEERGSAWMETVKRARECMDGDRRERGSVWMETVKRGGVHERSAWIETVKRSAWMETVKRERESTAKRERGVHG